MVIVGLVGLAPSLLQPARGQRSAPELEAFQEDRRRLAVFKRADPLPTPEAEEPPMAHEEPAAGESAPAKGPGVFQRLRSKVWRPPSALEADEVSTEAEPDAQPFEPVLPSFLASAPGGAYMPASAPFSPFLSGSAGPPSPPTPFATPASFSAAAAPTAGDSPASAFEAAFGGGEQTPEGAAEGDGSDDLMSLFRESKPANVIPESLQGSIERVSIAELLADVRATRELLAPLIERTRASEE